MLQGRLYGAVVVGRVTDKRGFYNVNIFVHVLLMQAGMHVIYTIFILIAARGCCNLQKGGGN